MKLSAMNLRHRQLERMERWAATASPQERFQAGLIGVLLPVVLTLCINPLLPPLELCDPTDFDFVAGICTVEPLHADSANRGQLPQMPEPPKEDAAK
jgi:hypothetical protein